MLAGQVQGVGGFYDHNIALQAQDKFSESVVSMLQIHGEVEPCRSDLKGVINSPADFTGRSWGSPTRAPPPTSSPSTCSRRTA
jgi:NitT/TauT family transport system substrate-binding protein